VAWDKVPRGWVRSYLMAELTRNQSDVSDYLFNLFALHKQQLQFEDLLYGDVARVIGTPSICIESGPVSIDRMPSRMQQQYTHFVIVYHGKFQDMQDNRKELDRFSQKVRDVVQTDRTMGGLVIDSWVSGIEPGYGVRSKSLWVMSRLTVTSKSQSNDDVNYGGL
jgi:hypothetical protein